jgi:hypothetical protein
LVEEVEQAHRIVMEEGARNSMIGTCRQMNMFPPAVPNAASEESDCEYWNTSADLSVIAQRLYNDQVRRLLSESGAGEVTAVSREERHAMTSAYIVDFAADVGFQLPELPDTIRCMLAGFEKRTSEWRQRHGACRSAGEGPGTHQRDMPRAFGRVVGIIGRGVAAVGSRLTQPMDEEGSDIAEGSGFATVDSSE